MIIQIKTKTILLLGLIALVSLIVFSPKIIPIFFEDRGPNEKEVTVLLLEEIIPSHIEVGELKFLGRQNVGLDTDPRIRARFEIKTKLKENTFKRVRNIAGRPILASSETQGKEAFFYGIATSRLVNNGWVTNFSFDIRPWRSWGEPIAVFNNNYLLEGSLELIDFQKKLIEDSPSIEAEIEKEKIIKLNNSRIKTQKLISAILGFDGIGSETIGDNTIGLNVDFYGINQETFEVTGRHFYRNKSINFFGRIDNGILKYRLNRNINVQLLLTPEGQLKGTYSRLGNQSPSGKFLLHLEKDGILKLNQRNEELIVESSQKYIAEGNMKDIDNGLINFEDGGVGTFQNDPNANPTPGDEGSGVIEYSLENGFLKIRFFEPEAIGKRCVAHLEYDGSGSFVGTREGCPSIGTMKIFLK